MTSSKQSALARPVPLLDVTGRTDSTALRQHLQGTDQKKPSPRRGPVLILLFLIFFGLKEYQNFPNPIQLAHFKYASFIVGRLPLRPFKVSKPKFDQTQQTPYLTGFQRQLTFIHRNLHLEDKNHGISNIQIRVCAFDPVVKYKNTGGNSSPPTARNSIPVRNTKELKT